MSLKKVVVGWAILVGMVLWALALGALLLQLTVEVLLHAHPAVHLRTVVAGRRSLSL